MLSTICFNELVIGSLLSCSVAYRPTETGPIHPVTDHCDPVRHSGRLEYALLTAIVMEHGIMYAWFCMLMLLALGLACLR